MGLKSDGPTNSIDVVVANDDDDDDVASCLFLSEIDETARETGRA